LPTQMKKLSNRITSFLIF